MSVERRKGSGGADGGLTRQGHLFIKICGIRQPAVAALAAGWGADAVGLNFAPSSPRQVTPEEATAVARAARGVRRDVLAVGIFLDPDEDALLAAVRAAGLNGVQLHGAAPAALCHDLRRRGLRVIRALPAGPDLPEEVEPYLGSVDAVLVDTPSARGGGSGRTFDWALATPLLGRLPVIVAGGLDPDNVADLVRHVAPAGVDVASGVEEAPGRKSPARVRRFIETVRRLEHRR